MRPLEQVLIPCDVVIELAPRNYGPIVPYASRVGIMGHYDASSSDRGAQNWFDDPAFLLSYNRAYTDAGRRIRLAPAIERKAFHAGKCRSDSRVHDNANTSFYALCVTATDGDVATIEQFSAFAVDAAVIARYHQLRGDPGWETTNIGYWLTGHEDWAIHYSGSTKRKELWGKLGRKNDPTGSRLVTPVLSKSALRLTIAAYLNDDPRGPFWSSYNFGV